MLHTSRVFLLPQFAIVPFYSNRLVAKGLPPWTGPIYPLCILGSLFCNSGSLSRIFRVRKEKIGLTKMLADWASATAHSIRAGSYSCLTHCYIMTRNCVPWGKHWSGRSPGVFIRRFLQFGTHLLRVANCLLQPLISEHSSHCSRDGADEIGADSSIEGPPSFFRQDDSRHVQDTSVACFDFKAIT